MSLIAEKSERRPSPRGALLGALIAGSVFLLFYAAGFGTHVLVVQHRLARVAEDPMAVFWEAWDVVEQNFYGDVPSAQARTYGAIRGALATLEDPYTVFLEPESGQIERDRLSGTYGGIGLDLWREGPERIVVNPYPNSPADASGIRTGDLLLAVDGNSVLTATLDQIRTLLRGEVGTPVTLTLSRPPTPTSPFTVTVIRQQIQIPSVTYRAISRHPDIGYVQIKSFTERTPGEVRSALRSLLHSGVSSLILDLRDNGGGLIQPATEVADEFLEQAVLLYEVRRVGQQRTIRTHPGGLATDIPLAVLVNGSTASAAEMLAGAFQVHGRGVLIGQPTFGKGSVQLIFALSDGSSLHVTTALWLLPDGQPLPPDGLTPDVLVPQGTGLDDPELEEAVQVLTARSE